ncbi:hypothetical protein [Ornithinibacillus halophilus]|uniref:Uncharacterized protein n=1 Tax=Ornithinibacillus halophilus TaxID=930117 RepID=A0A1M5NQN2_9BACI|nr:hypothetical protein [Ornithinibacillus halophilus]SHG91861.1 hypothetical protein SAMN05216225_10875 [Ornithinibacillus halophilus]
MSLSRWSFFQGLIIVLLVVLGFVADLYREDIAVPFSATGAEVLTPKLFTVLFLVIITGLISCIFYFQTKKSKTFLIHPLWEKMHVLLALIFVVSLVLFMIIIVIAPFGDVTQNNRWMIYVFLYYFLYLINLIVLTVVHKANKQKLTNENKVKQSFIWTVVVLVLIFIVL